MSEHEVVTSDGVCRLSGEYDPGARLGRYRFTLEGRGREAWRRAEFELVQRCHTDADVRGALYAAGFSEVETYDAVKDLDLPDEVGRVFYRALAS